MRLEQGGPGEVGELTEGFNQMAERLESARAELEEQNAQLRESERLKSDLVNTVSHELRTPLSGVLGFTKLLLSRDFDSETRRHYLGIVDAQARRLSELIDDFLDVRRIEEGRFERAQELLDMAALLREEAQLYSAQSPKHRLALTLPEEPLPVIGSPDRLRQVIGNLLSNAIKYSPRGGIVELRAEATNGTVRVEVQDEGIGIPAPQQAQIFTKFFRGDAAASGIPGTGLGLAVSRDIVESHGGRIGFTSSEGEGATFFVELPSGNGETVAHEEIVSDSRTEGDPMRKMLLICGALVGFALITGSITQGSPALTGPGNGPHHEPRRQGQPPQPRSSQSRRGRRPLDSPAPLQQGDQEGGDRSCRSRVHVHGPQSPAVQRDLLAPQRNARRGRIGPLP